MKKLLPILIVPLFLYGCQSITQINPNNQHIIIDWVDFIKWDGVEYNYLYDAVITSDESIGQVIGEVQFNVEKNIKNPSYAIKDGDAAFLDEGTPLYEVKGHPNLLAVESDDEINGYQLYYSVDGDYKWHYDDMAHDEVEKIDIYQHLWPDYQLLNEVTKQEDIHSLLNYLDEGEVTPYFQPNTQNGDPIYYKMIFYTGDEIAYQYGLKYDGYTYYWHPWDTNVLSDDMEQFINPDKIE
ncbi:hypothetical protein [Ornithinibacillus halotolerans]|uniref:Lipoprotein n=1 Tax=Ornithinibacillus halotolerans TaxID=1274357 RepID=A0A916W4R8_9BACI|nr:hypothetical protein [Ornithinibacillus halotolerans]GGA67796.1 hypothetical protein GCM10008025_09560 [Ornithinibacillus halotolerans]